MAVRIVILLDQHQDIVNIDFNLFDQFDFKDDIIGDILFFSGGLAVFPFIANVLIPAEIILQVSFRKNLISCELIKRGQQVAHTQDGAKQNHEFPLLLFAGNAFLREGKFCGQFFYHIGVAGMVFSFVILVAVIIILIAAHQYNAARIFITKEGNGFICALLQAAEADNVTEGLDGIQDAVCAGKSLNQPVHFQVFVHPQRVERGGVKACQKHIYHNEKIQISVLHPQGHIFVVVLEVVPVGGIIGAKHLVVVRNGRFQKITGALVKGGGVLRVFLTQNTVRFRFVCAIAVDQCDLEAALRRFRHLALEFSIVQFCRLHRGNRKNGIKAAEPLLLLDLFNGSPAAGGCHFGNVLQHAKGIGFASAIGFLVEVSQNIIGHQPDTLRR